MASSATPRAANTAPVLVTGCSGLIGSRVVDRLRSEFPIVGLDQSPLESADGSRVRWIECDLTQDSSVRAAMTECRNQVGDHLTSVIHLAAYYDFSGQPSPLYQDLTVGGTRRLLHEVRRGKVEQFVFSSSLLVMQPSENGEPLAEHSPVHPEWSYPQSKVEAEQVIAAERGDIPAVILRIAGVYDENCHSLPLSQQISRIYEKQLESYVFPGKAEHGQSYVHLDDLCECIRHTIVHRRALLDHEVFLIGEEDVMSYDELQETIGMLIHGKEWPTIRIPKAVAKAGAWVQGKLASSDEEEPFIKPWMIDLADQNFPLNISKAREKLHWEPRHSLRRTLPEMIVRLHADPRRWYEINKLPLPDHFNK